MFYDIIFCLKRTNVRIVILKKILKHSIIIKVVYMKKIIFLGILMILAFVGVLTACAAKTYEIDYCGEQQMYDGAKDSYAPGKEVTLRYTLIASDTSYAFYLDGEELDVEYDSNKGYFIRFTMPDHDVRLECVTCPSGI